MTPDRMPTHAPGDYDGPVRLRPIPWGKPDKATGFALCAHMRHANPPIVVLWSVHHAKVLRCMKHDEVREADLHDIDNLVLGHTPKFHNDVSQWQVFRWYMGARLEDAGLIKTSDSGEIPL